MMFSSDLSATSPVAFDSLLDIARCKRAQYGEGEGRINLMAAADGPLERELLALIAHSYALCMSGTHRHNTRVGFGPRN